MEANDLYSEIKNRRRNQKKYGSSNRYSFDRKDLDKLGLTRKIESEDKVLFTDKDLYYFVIGYDTHMTKMVNEKSIPFENYEIELFGRNAGYQDVHFNFTGDDCFWAVDSYEKETDFPKLFKLLTEFCKVIQKEKYDILK